MCFLRRLAAGGNALDSFKSKNDTYKRQTNTTESFPKETIGRKHEDNCDQTAAPLRLPEWHQNNFPGKCLGSNKVEHPLGLNEPEPYILALPPYGGRSGVWRDVWI